MSTGQFSNQGKYLVSETLAYKSSVLNDEELHNLLNYIIEANFLILKGNLASKEQASTYAKEAHKLYCIMTENDNIRIDLYCLGIMASVSYINNNPNQKLPLPTIFYQNALEAYIIASENFDDSFDLLELIDIYFDSIVFTSYAGINKLAYELKAKKLLLLKAEAKDAYAVKNMIEILNIFSPYWGRMKPYWESSIPLDKSIERLHKTLYSVAKRYFRI